MSLITGVSVVFISAPWLSAYFVRFLLNNVYFLYLNIISALLIFRTLLEFRHKINLEKLLLKITVRIKQHNRLLTLLRFILYL
jgi:hypothetical protein